MTYPLGYFTDHTPGNGGLLDELEKNYGSTFEKLTRRQKLYLITAIAADLACRSEGDDALLSQVAHVPILVHEQLDQRNTEGFLRFLASQVRFGNHAQPGSRD